MEKHTTMNVSNYLPEEVWTIIFIYTTKKQDGLKLRFVCKDAKEGFKQYCNMVTRTYPRRTFIQTQTCMCCDIFGTNVDIKTISYMEEHPQRWLLHCNKLSCFCSALMTFIFDMNSEHSYPFFKVKDNGFCNIKRSNGGYSIGKIIKNRPIVERNGILYCTAHFSQLSYGEKVKEIEQSFFDTLTIDQKKLVPVNDYDCVKVEKLFRDFFNIKIL